MLLIIFFLILALVAGFFIGCVGIGGVLLVPGLSFGGIEIHDAIAASLFSYIICGVVAAWIFHRKGSIEWTAAAWLSLAAMPAAVVGAVAATAMSATVLEGIIGLSVLFSGLRAFLRRPASSGTHKSLSVAQLLIIGSVTGFGSALTGTGGPFVLVPILVWFDLPILAVIGFSQAVQVPISLFATMGNYFYGHVDFPLGLLLGVGLLVGTTAGALVAHNMQTSSLRRLVGVLLLVAGAVFLARFAGHHGWQ